MLLIGRWGIGVNIGHFVMREGMVNLSVGLCGFCRVEGDAKFCSQMDIPEGM